MSDKKMYEREFRESRSHEAYSMGPGRHDDSHTTGNSDKDYFSLGTDLLYDIKNVARGRGERIMENITTDDILEFLGVNYNY